MDLRRTRSLIALFCSLFLALSLTPSAVHAEDKQATTEAATIQEQVADSAGDDESGTGTAQSTEAEPTTGTIDKSSEAAGTSQSVKRIKPRSPRQRTLPRQLKPKHWTQLPKH